LYLTKQEPLRFSNISYLPVKKIFLTHWLLDVAQNYILVFGDIGGLAGDLNNDKSTIRQKMFFYLSMNRGI